MAEWSKAHAWKVCVPHKGTKGSNPFLSAGSLQQEAVKDKVIPSISISSSFHGN